MLTINKEASGWKNNVLYRYTTFPFLVDILVRRKIALTNPENRKDKNDIATLRSFKGQNAYA